LEYLPGIKIDDRQTMEACGINTKEIIQLGICCYLKQLLQDGFFQSDPHPGNMAVSQDGHLIFYDFGTMTEVKPIAKDQMIKTFFAVLRKDTEEVINTLMYMGLIEPVQDMTPIRRLIAFTLDKFREKPVELQAFDQMRSEIYAMFEQQPFRLPAQMTFILKSITTLDGIARTLDPEYNLLSASKPFIKSLTVSKQGRGNVVGELARQARDFIQYKLRQPNATELLLRRLEERLEQGELQLNVRAIESERALKRINLAIKSLMYACLASFTLLSGTVLLGTYPNWAIAAFAFSGFWFLILLRSLIKLAVRERLDHLSER
jgi:predicted unusual protein kinase regulating ubiquinone biosynthesis (AarF/ABC1/UbiB family)